MALANRRRRTAVGLALLVGLATLIPPPAMARWAYPPWDFDIVGVSVDPSTVEQGGSVTATVSIKNTGSEIGTVSVFFGVQRPDGGPEYSGPRKIFDIPVGETRSLSWLYTPSAGTGQYWVNFDVYSPPETHMFDTTGFVHSLTVTSPASQSDPMATRNSPSSATITLEEGASQTFVANLYDADCDLNYAEWYLEDPPSGPGTHLMTDDSPQGCSGSTSRTQTFPAEGTFEVEVVVFDGRNHGAHVGRARWVVTVTSADTGGEPQECVKSGNALRFAGYDWEVKEGVWGPGPLNTWDPENVWCDEATGFLHLKIENNGGVWTNAEVNTTESFGYGHYEFKVSGDALGTFHDRVVLGLFNYPPKEVDRDGWDEIDIEFSRWGNADREPGQFVVYPTWNWFRGEYRSYRFRFDPIVATTTHRYTWQSEHVTFESLIGSQQFGWRHEEDPLRRIPTPPLPVHINLWLYRGPTVESRVADSAIVGAATEIVIEDFSWQPEAIPASLRWPLPLG